MKKSPSNSSLPTTPNILAIEASANQLSIAVLIRDEVVAERRHLAAHGHAVGIVPLAIETINAAGVTFNAMTHIAAGCGPGSFTGIRVALAAAKGFCIAHQAIGIGVSGLQALAHAASHAAADITMPCLVLADTRRGPLYAQIFDARAQPMSTILETSINHLLQLIDAKIFASGLRVIGMKRMAVADALDRAGIITDLPAIDEMPSASMVARLASEQIVQHQTAPLHPIYLADPRLGTKKESGR